MDYIYQFLFRYDFAVCGFALRGLCAAEGSLGCPCLLSLALVSPYRFQCFCQCLRKTLPSRVALLVPHYFNYLALPYVSFEPRVYE